jgi:hypothetical protein
MIDQLSELELLRLKALEQYYFDDMIPEQTKIDVINFSLEDLKSYFMIDIEEFKSELINRMPEYHDSWIKDQLKEIQTLLD